MEKGSAMRTGVLARKIGMTRLFNEDGQHIPVTVLSLDDCQVVGQRTKDKDGYTALQLGSGTVRVKNITKQQRGHFAKAQVAPKRKLVEFRVAEDALLDIGSVMNADHFVAGQRVDATGVSIGKGFAGAMKRWGFGGLRASHGVSISHRSHGSTGQRQDPGKVFKNKKMAGHMGAQRVTQQNLTIIQIDNERGLIFVGGSVPGHKDGWVLLRDAQKIARHKDAPYPGSARPGDAYSDTGFKKATSGKKSKKGPATAKPATEKKVEKKSAGEETAQNATADKPAAKKMPAKKPKAAKVSAGDAAKGDEVKTAKAKASKPQESKPQESKKAASEAKKPKTTTAKTAKTKATATKTAETKATATKAASKTAKKKAGVKEESKAGAKTKKSKGQSDQGAKS